MTIKSWMIYGAYGYTGRLIVAEAVKRGHLPIIAGRDEARLLDMADQYGLVYRVFAADDHRKVKLSLDDVGVVLNCAGPFSQTATAIRTACLAKPCHYLDITGEIDVLEASYQTHTAARKAGCVIISGAGFDVVPTDFLALALKERLPTATSLELAFAGGAGVSPGTAKTMLEMLVRKGCIREKGELKQVSLLHDSQYIDFADKKRFCVTIPWGDVATAFHSTAIPDIRVYTAIEPYQAKWLWLLDKVAFLLAIAWLQGLLKKQISRHVQGPEVALQQQATMQVWGRASDGENTITLCMETPEAYRYTVVSALMMVEALLAHKILPGAYTPSQALPAEAVFAMEGVHLYTDHDQERNNQEKP